MGEKIKDPCPRVAGEKFLDMVKTHRRASQDNHSRRYYTPAINRSTPEITPSMAPDDSSILSMIQMLLQLSLRRPLLKSLTAESLLKHDST